MNKLTPEEKLNIAFEKAYPDTAEVEFIGNIYDIFATGYQSALSMIGHNKEDAETVLRDHLRERTAYYEFGIYDVIPAMEQYAAQEVAGKDRQLERAKELLEMIIESNEENPNRLGTWWSMSAPLDDELNKIKHFLTELKQGQ